MSVIHAPRTPTLDGRTLVFPLAVALALVVIFLRLWYIQVVKAADLSERAAFFRNTLVPKVAPRGLIFDRNGVVLAGVQSRFVLTAVPALVRKNPWVLDKVASLLGTDVKKLEEKVQAGRWKPYIPTTIFVGVPIEIAARVAEAGADLPGIGVESQPMRHYPDSKSFSDVLGYVWVPSEKDAERLSSEGLKPATYVGKTGIEYVYERDLMGVPGADHLEVDSKRRPTKVVSRDNPVPGDHLKLGLDANLQKIALADFAGRPGAAVAIDPQTGEVLCLASSPTYDAGLFDNGISTQDWQSLNEDPLKPLVNRAVAGMYPPGSTFKLVTSIAAESVGKFNPNRTYYCPGYLKIGNRKLKCENHAPGILDFHDALEKSCNTFFGSYAVEIGEDAIRNAAIDCGFYEKSGLDLTGLQRGVIPTAEWVKKNRKPARWYTGDTANIGIGQGDVAVTPLQMADLVALVGNEGTMFKPHLVVSVTHPGGQEERIEPQIMHQVSASPQFWADIKAAMTDVIAAGTARKAQIAGLTWAGKTGSAEYKKNKPTHAWFVGFAPVDHPRIAVAVVVEGGGHGGETAAPIARDLVKRYLAAGSNAKALSNSPAAASARDASPGLPSVR